MRRAAALTSLILLVGAGPSRAQLPAVRGYYLNVPTWSDSTPFAVGGLGDLNRLRLMSEPAAGDFTAQVAYEQVLSLSRRPAAGPSAIYGGIVPSGGEWLDLQWTIERTDHATWSHRFDRLNLRYAPGDLVELVAGRQAISWATTLILTPANPFPTFTPSDPFREYLPGVDALRVEVFPGPLSDIDFVVRPSQTTTSQGTLDNVTAVARGRTVWKSWELSAWAGGLYTPPAVAAAAAGSLGGIALRAEGALIKDGERVVPRGAVGVDGRATALGRDLYFMFEFQHDGFGASGAAGYAAVIRSPQFARGQLQVLGRDEIAAQANYRLHPLWTLNLLGLWNLNDPSALLSPAAAYSLSNEATAQAGIFLGLGPGQPGAPGTIPSEYGILPTTVYGSISLFF